VKYYYGVDSFLFKKNVILFEKCQKRYKFHNNQDREISLCIKTDSFVFKVKDVVSFEGFTKTNEVFYQLHEKGTQQLLEYWFTHTLLPIFFTLTNKYYFLHAGAVKVDNTNILFMADSMGGKSTMTDHFLQKGHPLISDDKVGTFEENGKFMLVSSYPYHRPYRKFEDLGYKVENFVEGSGHLDVIYMLDVNETYDKVTLEELKGIEKVSLLIRGTDIGLPVHLKERFAHVTALANATPVFRVHIPKDLERLSEAYEQIVKNTKQIGEKNELR
jgi:hypothetical protein